MSRLHFKGGPWTNQEDQFLLAALTKYGLRDWARVASVLQNKTAQQCRERYENYLDQGLHLTEEWSLEEEEELLKLQSLFPYKWRTISEQITRRTSTHYRRPPWLCEQHYQKLLDAHEFEKRQAAAKLDGEPELSFGAFMEERRRRRGKQLAHEERAARADTAATATEKREAHDLLISRLANQDQKKGLRKQRKQQQQETSYLAKLENNREAIEAGTLSGRQRKRMRQAMDEDRQGRATVLDRIVEEDEDDADDDSDGDRLAIGVDADDSDADEDAMVGRRGKAARGARRGARAAFTPIDMNDDLAKAGIEKQSRKLYGGHIEAFSGQESGKDASGHGGALPVHHNRLDLLITGSDDTASASSRPMIASHAHVSSSSAETGVRKLGKTVEGGGASSSGLTWDALAGPSTDTPDLDALFAALPEAGESAPKRSKKEKAPAVSQGAMNTAQVDDMFATLPLPDGDVVTPPSPHAVSSATAHVAETGTLDPVSADMEAVPVRTAEEYMSFAKSWVAEAMQQSPEILAPALRDEALMRALGDARQAVEAEIAAHTSDTIITAADVARTQQHMRIWAKTTVRDEERASLDSHHTEAAESALARRHSAFARLETLVSQCFVDRHDTVMAGGRYLLSPSPTNKEAAAEAEGEEEASVPGARLHYLGAYWANALARRRGQATLLSRLREEEVVVMQQVLDSLETELSSVLAEERRLQAEYRARQLHAKSSKRS